MNVRMRISRLLMVIGLVGFIAQSGYADTLTVSDGDSSITVDPHGSSGLRDWNVDGTDHLFQQWFWFRFGDTGGETSLDNLSLIHEETHGGDTIHLTYSGQFLIDNDAFSSEVDLTYTVIDGLGGTSRIEESIELSYEGLDRVIGFHFFEYTDLDVDGSAFGDTATLLNPSAIAQGDTSTVTVTSQNIVPDHWEIGSFPTIRNSLDDLLPTTLADGVSPSGPTDLTHAFQYDFDLSAGDGVVTIRKTKDLGDFQLPQQGGGPGEPIPEPGTMLLFGIGSAFLAWFRRR